MYGALFIEPNLFGRIDHQIQKAIDFKMSFDIDLF